MENNISIDTNNDKYSKSPKSLNDKYSKISKKVSSKSNSTLNLNEKSPK